MRERPLEELGARGTGEEMGCAAQRVRGKPWGVVWVRGGGGGVIEGSVIGDRDAELHLDEVDRRRQVERGRGAWAMLVAEGSLIRKVSAHGWELLKWGDVLNEERTRDPAVAAAIGEGWAGEAWT